MLLVPVLVLSLCISIHAQSSVTTHRNNLARSGENLTETVLTPANVNPAQFGKIAALPVDGQLYAQPLYLPSVAISGKGVHNVMFVATEHDSVYAFDADSFTGANRPPLWQVSLVDTAAGETTASVADVMNCPTIAPELGITGTPVIDPSTGTLYVVAMTARDGLIFHRLHALDIASGAERPGSPVLITASVPGTGDRALSYSSTSVNFDAYFYKNRAGLLLLNGVVYTGWTSHCDSRSYHGWILAYDARSLHQVSVFNTTPNAYQGSIWMGGAAPAADAAGNIYAVSGNGRFDADANGSDFGNSVIKLSSPSLTVLDYFTPFNQLDLDRDDIDLGSSGAVLLPDLAGSLTHPRLLVSAGKEGRIYLLDRDRMGRFQPGGDSQIVQSITGAVGPVFGGPAYFNGNLYFSPSEDKLKAFSISAAHIEPIPLSQSARAFNYPGAVPAVSANGASNGIVWLVESGTGGTLHAFDAANLANELYSTQMNSPRDALGSFVKFAVPTVANGRVYLGTRDSLAVFGLLNQPSPDAVVNAASFQPGPVAPGSLITIFGSHLSGVTLFVNGLAAPILFAGDGQINAQVPLEVTEGWARLVLQQAGRPPVSFALKIAPVAPGLFGFQNAPDNPASVGSVVTVYLTGQGTVAPAISLTVGNRQAAVTFAAPSPNSAGLFQIDFIVPEVAAGTYPLVVTMNGVASNTRPLNVSQRDQR